MAWKEVHSSFSPKMNAPLDNRLVRANIAERDWIDGKYWGMRVYTTLENENRVLVKNFPTNIHDPRNWVSLSSYLWETNQADVKFMTFLTIAQAEAAMWVIDSEFCFVFETKMFYHCEVWSTEIPNNNDVLDLDWGAASEMDS